MHSVKAKDTQDTTRSVLKGRGYMNPYYQQTMLEMNLIKVKHFDRDPQNNIVKCCGQSNDRRRECPAFG